MENKRKNLRIGSGLAVLTFALANCASGIFTTPAQAQFSSISEKEEIKAGQQAREQAIKEYGQPLSSSDPRQQRVARLGRLFANNAKRKNIPYSYTVLKNDTVLNAFAAPGGPVFVTTKLVATASNDAELAYVLGHETGHIENKHIVKAVKKQQQVGLAAGILGAIIGRKSGGGDVTGAILSTGVALWDSGYSRDNERDADSFGVRAMSNLGFDPKAAVSMLGKLGGSGGGLSKYLATHPSPVSRQKLVNELIQKENLTQVATRAGGPFLSYGNRRADGSFDNGDYNATTVALNNQDYNQPQNTQSDDLALRVQPYNNYRVIMAPVAAVVDFAGGRVEGGSDRNTVTVSRGNSYVRLTQNSTSAILNGRSVAMSAPFRTIDGIFYAPIGTLAEGLGGTATYDSTRNSVLLQINGQSRYLSLNE